jgi:hypothetical protein
MLRLRSIRRVGLRRVGSERATPEWPDPYIRSVTHAVRLPIVPAVAVAIEAAQGALPGVIGTIGVAIVISRRRDRQPSKRRAISRRPA